MNFKIERQSLNRLIQNVLPAISAKSGVEALQCVRIEAVQQGIVLSATDLRVSLHAMTGADVKAPGIYGVAAKPLHDIISSLDDGLIQLFIPSGKNQIQIKTDRSACHLNVVPGEEYPMLPNYEHMKFTEVPKEFFDQVERVSFCAAKDDDQRPYLSGVCFFPDKLASIDGYRLASLEHKLPIEKQTLVPASSLERIRKSLSGDKLFIAFGDAEIHFQSGSVVATLRLLEGQFPNYQQVIPGGPYDSAMVKKSDLIKSLKFVNNLADAMNRVRLEFKPGRLKLFATSQTGDAEDIIECQSAQEFKTHVSAKFLLQSLEHIKGETVSFELREPKKPLVLREEGYVQVIMPQRE